MFRESDSTWTIASLAIMISLFKIIYVMHKWPLLLDILVKSLILNFILFFANFSKFFWPTFFSLFFKKKNSKING